MKENNERETGQGNPMRPSIFTEPEMSAPVHPTQPAGTSFFQPHSKPRSQTSLIEAAMLSRNKIYM